MIGCLKLDQLSNLDMGDLQQQIWVLQCRPVDLPPLISESSIHQSRKDLFLRKESDW
jgi:hypothetical protein